MFVYSRCFADPMAMWHVRAEIARSILLVVDFGNWYMEDAKAGEKAKACGDGMPSNVIAHTDVSLTKDVIVPYTLAANPCKPGRLIFTRRSSLLQRRQTPTQGELTH